MPGLFHKLATLHVVSMVYYDEDVIALVPAGCGVRAAHRSTKRVPILVCLHERPKELSELCLSN